MRARALSFTTLFKSTRFRYDFSACRLPTFAVDRHRPPHFRGYVGGFETPSTHGFSPMSRAIHKLTPAVVRQKNKAGVYPDGGGLYLQVTIGADRKPKKSWLVRVRTPGGRVREMGLGPANDTNLATTRDKARQARDLAREGTDPILHRKAEKKRIAEEAARAITFKEASESYITTFEESWRNPKHRQQWRNSLSTYAYPAIGSMRVQDIELDDVLKVLQPIWKTKNETASRVRGRIETILDWAAIKGMRNGDNPARWRNYLQRALPPINGEVKHQRALPFAELPTFMKALRRDTSMSARALEFTILTAARSGETREATWDEIDMVNAVWTIPAARMKATREHRVPLGARAMEILGEMQELALSRREDWVFPGGRHDRPLSNTAMKLVIQRLGRSEDAVPHGFRSTFRDWCAECTTHQREVAEAALAHVSGDKVELAYRRGDFWEKRRVLMREWDRFANGKKPENKASPKPKHAKLKKRT